MSKDGKDFEQKITADPTGFIAGFAKAHSAALSSAKGIEGAVDMIGGAFKNLFAPLRVLGELVAGGAFFGVAIEASRKLTGESMVLARSLGITGTEASALRTELEEISSDGEAQIGIETYTGAFQKFAKQLKNHEEVLQNMGLKTRAANGELRDGNTLFTEALHVVGSYKTGIDQTTAAMMLFGRSVGEVIQLQKLSSKGLEEAKKKNEELGLTITTEGVEASRQFGLALNDIEDVFMGIKNAIAQAVMPILTQLGGWFNAIGPTAVFTFKVAIDTLATALQAVILVVKSVWTVVSAIADPLFTFGRALKMLISGDVTGAFEEMKKTGANWGTAMSGVFDKIATDSKATWTDVKNLWGHGTEVAVPGAGTKPMGDMKKLQGTSPSQMPQLELELAQRKAALVRAGLEEGQLREMSKAEELKYWSDIGARRNLDAKDRQAVARKTAETELAMIKDRFTVDVAALDAQAAAYKNNTEERLRLEREIQAKYQQGTKEYEAAAKKIVEIQRQAADQERVIRDSRMQAERDARLQTLALEEQAMQTSVQLGIVTQGQLLAAQADFENRRNAIAREALEQRKQIAELDPDKNKVEVEKINTELEALERQHQLRLGQIRGAAQLENDKYQAQFFAGMQNSLQSSLAGLLNGTQRIGTAFKNMFASMAQTLAQTVAKMSADWLMGQIRMRLASKETSLTQLNNNAMAAAGGAYNAIVGIPYVGPFLAPVAAATAYAGVMAFGSLASAEGGFDIPGNINPLVQAHAREMILPAKHADVIRSLADNGAAARTRAGDSGGGLTLNGHHMPNGFFMAHQDELVRVFKHAIRNGHAL